MEGVPRMPMLSVDSKFSSASVDFGPQLGQYIASYYQESPANYAAEIDELNNLRERAVKAPANYAGIAVLRKYFAQLTMLKARFPMEEDQYCAVQYAWFEKHSDTPLPVSVADVRFEMACILYNIGALYSCLGALDSRISSDGMKASCTYFQCAAWAFDRLADLYGNFAKYSQDFEPNLLSWLSQIMLAQAQECILEKSLIDTRKNLIVAKIAVEISDLYKKCVNAMESSSMVEIVSGIPFKNWKKFMLMKSAYYFALTHLYRGMQSDDEKKMGERLTYYTGAKTNITDAAKILQSLGSVEQTTAGQAVQFLRDVVMTKYENAEKENDFIYHEKVPTLESMPALKGALLVKQLGFDPLDTEISGQEIFARLVPLEIHSLSSLYSEEKAKILREWTEKVEMKDRELEEFCSVINIDGFLRSMEDDGSLPEELIEACAALKAEPRGIDDFKDSLEKLSSQRSSVESSLKDIEEMLSTIKAELIGLVDPDGKVAKTDVGRELEQLFQKLQSYRDTARNASESDAGIVKVWTFCSKNLGQLARSTNEIRSKLPTIVSADEVSTVSETLRKLGEKVEEMKKQRKSLVDKLRADILADDIAKILLASESTDTEKVFETEIAKHSKTKKLIELNLEAQGNICKALMETNAKLGPLRLALIEQTDKRKQFINSLLDSFVAFKDLRQKCRDGLTFYETLEIRLTELKKAVDKFCKQAKVVRREPVALKAAPGTARGSCEPKLKDYLALHSARKAARAAAAAAATAATATSRGATAMPPQNYTSASQPYGAEHSSSTSGVAALYSRPASSYYTPSVQSSPNVFYQHTSATVCPTNVDQYATQMPLVTNRSLSYASAQTSVRNSSAVHSSSDGYPYASYSVVPNASSPQQPSLSGYARPFQLPLQNVIASNVPNVVSSSSSTPAVSYQQYAQGSLYYESCLAPQVPSQPSAGSPSGARMPNVSSQRPLSIQNPQYGQSPFSDGTVLYNTESFVPGTNWTSPYQNSSTLGSQSSPYFVVRPAQSVPSAIHPGPQPVADYYAAVRPSYGGFIYQTAASGGTASPNAQVNVTMPDRTSRFPATGFVQSATPQSVFHQSVRPAVLGSTLTAQMREDIDSTVPNNLPPPLIPTGQTVSAVTESKPQVPSNCFESAPSPGSTTGSISAVAMPLHSDPHEPPCADEALQKEIHPTVLSSHSNSVAPFGSASSENLMAEYIRLARIFESLKKKSLNGQMPLELQWKEITKYRDVEARKHSISVARCYPLKNRSADIMPYDICRVCLQRAQDDYINASFVPKLSDFGPHFILTQAPVTYTLGDFWLMVYERKIELCCCIVAEDELSEIPYWCHDRKPIHVWNIQVIFVKDTCQSCCTELSFVMVDTETKERHDVGLLIFTYAKTRNSFRPGADADRFAQFISVVRSYPRKQASSAPICALSLCGEGMNCAFAVLLSAVEELLRTGGMPGIVQLVENLHQYQKTCISSENQLYFIHEAALSVVKSLLPTTAVQLDKVTSGEIETGPSAVVNGVSLATKNGISVPPETLVPPVNEKLPLVVASGAEEPLVYGASAAPVKGTKTDITNKPAKETAALDFCDLDLCSPPTRQKTSKLDFLPKAKASQRPVLKMDAFSDLDVLNKMKK